jgi:hypothetical protein
MSVNFEIKGMLAKCLAMEDIIIEHKKVETACFNVHTRVLTLPMWEKASDNIYTMLVLHEISHALWTPNYDWTKECNIPGQFVNICEDARVEKHCKRKYPGSPKTFYNGYKELKDLDFFDIGEDDVNTFNLADRINLYYKIGNHLNLNFTEEEKTIVELIGNAETFEDTLDAAKILYEYCKEKYQDEMIQINEVNSKDGGSSMEFTFEESNESPDQTISGNSMPQSDSMKSDESESSEDESESSEDESESSEDESESSESDKPSNSQQDQNSQSDENKGGEQTEQKDPEIKTMESFEKALQNLISNDSVENTYIEIPEIDLNEIIIPNSEIHEKCNIHWTNPDDFIKVDFTYKKFKKDSQKEVNYLVKEFECRKAADSYARATTAKTGVLNCSILHTYKFNEDLFKKVTTISDGKNHGLVFILDWSGSMEDIMLDTIKQLFNLIWFCRKVSIPFEVYAFTQSYPNHTYDDQGRVIPKGNSYLKKENFFQIDVNFSLMNILTSKVNTSTLDKQMINIYRLASYFGNRYYNRYSIPFGMDTSGTPLNETMISLHQILPKFQKQNNLQKVHCIVLTDGEGHPLKYHKEFNRKWETSPYLGVNYVDEGCYLRDRKTGNTYSLFGYGYDMTDVLIRNLRDKFMDMSFIGIRVLEPGYAGSFIRRYTKYESNEYNQINLEWKKNKSFILKNSGYHSYFGFGSNSLSQNSQFMVSDSASKSEIKNAFVKSLKVKQLNKKILGEFIELIV